MSFEHPNIVAVIEKYNLAHTRNKYFMSVEGIICHLFGRTNKRNVHVLECSSANTIRSKLVAHSILEEQDGEYYIHVAFFVAIYNTLGADDVHDVELRDTSDLGKDFVDAVNEIKETTYKTVPNIGSTDGDMMITLNDLRNKQDYIISLLEQQHHSMPQQQNEDMITADDSVSNVSAGSDDTPIESVKVTTKKVSKEAKGPIAGSIYLLYFKDNKEYYKVGRTKQALKERLKKYKNYTLVHSKETSDIVGTENKIIDDFGKKYKLYKGREWFIGGKDDKKTMIGIIDEHTA